MELKLGALGRPGDEMVVLIVPLWNWNNETFKLGYNGFSRSNRTFMELKLLSLWKYTIEIVCSNRTFMELKYPY